MDSYFRTAKKLGGTNEQAQALVDYHIKLSGIPRQPKLKWYIEEVLKQEATNDLMQEVLEAFGLAVKKGLMGCRVAEGLHDLRERTLNANWLVVSEANQEEMQILFEQRGLADLFSGGIFGSPNNKDEILVREKENDNIKMPALFIGDCQYDYEAANRAGLDFVFLSAWTDMPDWEVFCERNKIRTYRNIKSL